MSKWIRKGDRVLVIAGNEKGKSGEVLSRGEERVLIQGVNMRKKAFKAKKAGEKGQMVELAMPIHVSNVKKA